jgi:biopolymer transport protein ExbB/TolQ
MGGSISSNSVTTLIGGVIIGVIAFGAIAYWVFVLQKKLRIFMNGKDGADLESTIFKLTEKVATLEETLKAHKEGLEYIDARVKRSIRGYSLVRYNAYDDAGGEQSFASGLLDEHTDGYILSVITNRNHVGVYAKKVVNGNAETSLTAEEKEALTQSKQSLEM